MKILLLRHGKTPGNINKRFIGATDEDLSFVGIQELEKKRHFLTELYDFSDAEIFVSPMRRCIGTCEILFPGAKYSVYDDLRECDFGILENKCHDELLDDPAYQEFISNSDAKAFPGGENIQDFLNRCAICFKNIICEKYKKNDAESVIIIAHGGTIMGIMNAYSEYRNEHEYNEWSPANGCGYFAELTCTNGELLITNAKSI